MKIGIWPFFFIEIITGQLVLGFGQMKSKPVKRPVLVLQVIAFTYV